MFREILRITRSLRKWLFYPDIALVCANGKPKGEFMNLNADEAALLTKMTNPRIVIPVRYGLLAEVDEDAQKFVDALKKQNVPVECMTMDFKGCYLYNGQSPASFRGG